MNEFQSLMETNLSIDLLVRFGNDSPDQKQIDLMESLLTSVINIQNVFMSSKLNSIEMKCLYFATKGKTSLETGEILSIEAAAINWHKKEIKRKLNAASMAEAVFKGIQLGYVTQDK